MLMVLVLLRQLNTVECVGHGILKVGNVYKMLTKEPFAEPPFGKLRRQRVG
jgi:hypothetical protein